MFRTVMLIVLLILCVTPLACAHDAWFAPSGSGLVMAYGHGEKLDPYNPEKVKDVKALDCNGIAVPVEVARQKESASISWKGNPATVTAFFDGGYGVKTTEGWKKTTKREAQGKYSIIDALKSQKFTKALVGPCANFSKPLGLALEIVPEKDPLALKPGEALPLKVLLRGQPLEGAIIKAGGTKDEKARTDKDGKASVVIDKPGLQLIVVSHKAPLQDDPDADTLALSSSLTFEAKQRHASQ